MESRLDHGERELEKWSAIEVSLEINSAMRKNEEDEVESVHIGFIHIHLCPLSAPLILIKS